MKHVLIIRLNFVISGFSFSSFFFYLVVVFASRTHAGLGGRVIFELHIEFWILKYFETLDELRLECLTSNKLDSY